VSVPVLRETFTFVLFFIEDFENECAITVKVKIFRGKDKEKEKEKEREETLLLGLSDSKSHAAWLGT
jgi:hypothetical protein